jgi:branched-chain amino acid transport system permease protein
MKKVLNALYILSRHKITAGFIVILLLTPLFFGSLSSGKYYMRLAFEVFIFAAAGTAWNILGGFGRQTSWASASFFAVGAYTGVLTGLHYGTSPWLSMLLCMPIAGLLAVIIGAPSFKLRGVFFSIATISFANIARQLLIYLKDFSGGAQGIRFPIAKVNSFWLLRFKSNADVPFYYVAMAWMLLSVAVVIVINRSRLGYYLKAIREDEDAAESLGIRAHRMKLYAFIISSMLLAVSGTFYAYRMGNIDPATVASHDLSIKIAVIAIVGGMGTVWGPVLGSFIAVLVLEFANRYLSMLGSGGAGFAIYGLAMVLIVLLRPNGLITFWTNYESRRAALRLERAGKGADH